MKGLILFICMLPGIVCGQITVSLSLDKVDYLRYEKIKATVTLENYSARRIELKDSGAVPWLNFRVLNEQGMPVALVEGQSPVAPLVLEPGEKATLNINLTARYYIRSPGSYRIRAQTTYGETFTSKFRVINVAEGKTLWSREVGVLDDQGRDTLRLFTLIKFPLTDAPRLYLQVEDRRERMILANYPLGNLISVGSLEADFDRQRHLHVLFRAAPRGYSYYEIGPDGKVVQSAIYTNLNDNPHLMTDGEGRIIVEGGELEVEPAEDAPRLPQFDPETRFR